MSRDPLLADDWPTDWVPFSVEVRPDGRMIELIAYGHLDGWTAGALLRNLTAVYEASFDEIHLDLRGVVGLDASSEPALARCREFAARRGAGFRMSTPRQPGPRDRPLTSSA